MGTITSYEEDASAMGRINGWLVAIEVAKHHLFGGGMSYQHEIFFLMWGVVYSTDVIAAHSIFSRSSVRLHRSRALPRLLDCDLFVRGLVMTQRTRHSSGQVGCRFGQHGSSKPGWLCGWRCVLIHAVFRPAIQPDGDGRSCTAVGGNRGWDIKHHGALCMSPGANTG